jgi:hypothetical protein
MKTCILGLLAIAFTSGLAVAAAPVLAPSGILATPSKFDRQNVTVLGLVANLVVRPVGDGTMYTQFQVCDSRCVVVVNPGKPRVSDGQNATVNGTFYTFFARGPIQLHDIIVVAPQ